MTTHNYPHYGPETRYPRFRVSVRCGRGRPTRALKPCCSWKNLHDNMDIAAILVMSVDDYRVQYRPLRNQLARPRVTPNGADVPEV